MNEFSPTFRRQCKLAECPSTGESGIRPDLQPAREAPTNTSRFSHVRALTFSQRLSVIILASKGTQHRLAVIGEQQFCIRASIDRGGFHPSNRLENVVLSTIGIDGSRYCDAQSRRYTDPRSEL
jgi:hypothetical protein